MPLLGYKRRTKNQRATADDRKPLKGFRREAAGAAVDFGFNVGLAEFEKSTRYGKLVPLRFRFQLRLDRRFFGFN